jgi:hypothetical protein
VKFRLCTLAALLSAGSVSAGLVDFTFSGLTGTVGTKISTSPNDFVYHADSANTTYFDNNASPGTPYVTFQPSNQGNVDLHIGEDASGNGGSRSLELAGKAENAATSPLVFRISPTELTASSGSGLGITYKFKTQQSAQQRNRRIGKRSWIASNIK